MVDEGPVISYDPSDPLAPEGILLPGMCLSVESYIGAVNGAHGIKREQQYVITETAAVLLGDKELPQRLEVFDRQRPFW
jgi:Xaa-Pro aminopeptidase